MSTYNSVVEWEILYGVKLNPYKVKNSPFEDEFSMSKKSFLDLALKFGYVGNEMFDSVIANHKEEHDKRIQELAIRFEEIAEESGIEYTKTEKGKGSITLTNESGDVVAKFGGDDGMSSDEFANYMWNLPYISAIESSKRIKD